MPWRSWPSTTPSSRWSATRRASPLWKLWPTSATSSSTLPPSLPRRRRLLLLRRRRRWSGSTRARCCGSTRGTTTSRRRWLLRSRRRRSFPRPRSAICRRDRRRGTSPWRLANSSGQRSSTAGRAWRRSSRRPFRRRGTIPPTKLSGPSAIASRGPPSRSSPRGSRTPRPRSTFTSPSVSASPLWPAAPSPRNGLPREPSIQRRRRRSTPPPRRILRRRQHKSGPGRPRRPWEPARRRRRRRPRTRSKAKSSSSTGRASSAAFRGPSPDAARGRRSPLLRRPEEENRRRKICDGRKGAGSAAASGR
mmetsp:Transcript_23713/g.76194  ORF Transcript_23713/g.76194 Transcript_23713/m.76194 type:complete len:306 (+) Transcript_23713:335-1252(+)